MSVIPRNKVFIVAEIGQNHDGKFEKAKLLIETAKDCGVDAVKFTKMDITKSYTQNALKRPYISPNSFGKTYGEHRKNLELSVNQMHKLKKYAENLGLVWFCSVCDIPSFKQMELIGNPIIKLPSREISNIDLIKHIAHNNRHKKPIILSAGLATLYDINAALNILQNSQLTKNIHLLHCVSEYPNIDSRVNLRRIKTLKNIEKIKTIGYSSHNYGITDAIIAVSLGARIIEKHIKLHFLESKGSDKPFALYPALLKRLVRSIRKAELMLGNNIIWRSLPNYIKKEMKKQKIDGGYKIL